MEAHLRRCHQQSWLWTGDVRVVVLCSDVFILSIVHLFLKVVIPISGEMASDTPYEVAISIPVEGYEPVEFTLSKICGQFTLWLLIWLVNYSYYQFEIVEENRNFIK